MRVCIPTNDPGGPESPVADSFQDSDLLDFYDLEPNGRHTLSAQIRNCAGTCKDNVETVVRRGAEAVIAKSMSSSSVNRFKNNGVTIYLAIAGPSEDSLSALNHESLRRMDQNKT